MLPYLSHYNKYVYYNERAGLVRVKPDYSLILNLTVFHISEDLDAEFLVKWSKVTIALRR